MILHPAQPVAVLGNAERKEQSQVTLVADTGAYGVVAVTCPATAAAAQGDYFVAYNQAGDSYAVWLDIDAAGTPPSGAAYLAADNQVEVDIVTGDTAAQVATKVAAALTMTDVTDLAALAVVTLTQDLIGAVTAPTRHNTGDTGNGSFTLSVSNAGAASNLQSKYFLINSADDATAYYVWFNVGTEGVDPAVSASTGIEVAISASDASTAVATAVQVAVDAETDFTATVSGSTVEIKTAAQGSSTDAGAGDSSLVVVTEIQGLTATIGYANPGTTVASLSNNPSVL